MITGNLPTTSELFIKHFDGKASVNLSHPNVEKFFQELNEVCLEEDRRKDQSLTKK